MHSQRILALVADAFGSEGGIATYDRHLIGSLASCRDVAEIVVVPRRGRSAIELPPRVRQLRSVGGRAAYSLAALWEALSRGPFDVIFCGHLYMAPSAAALARIVGAHLWIQVHGVEAWHELSLPYRISIESAALVTAVSRDTRRRLLQWAGLDPGRVKVLPNTLDPRFQPGPKSSELLDRYGLRDKQILLTISRLSAKEGYKGHDRVIRALPHVLSQHLNAVYLIVGDGDDRKRLEQLAKESGVGDKVRFVGRVSDEQIVDYFRLADVFVMPSTAEGFGIVFIEAMASGATVIAGNKDGSVDALCDGLLGRAIDPESNQDLVRAINEALACPRTYSNQVERFSRERFAGHLEGLLSQIFFHADKELGAVRHRRPNCSHTLATAAASDPER
jgi:phosphatidyl-myo-inositol dimannoside synthase